MKVLRLSPPSGRARRQRVTLEGGLTLRVRPDDVVALDLEPGRDLDDAMLASLRASADATEALDRALRLLAVRLRSRLELADRLRRNGFGDETVDATLARLEHEGFIDDARFSRAWVAGRLALRPSGAVRLRQELRQKGVASDLIEQVLRAALSESDERDQARSLAGARARLYRGEAPHVAYRRLAGVLQRRGFSAGAVAAALRDVLGDAAPAIE